MSGKAQSGSKRPRKDGLPEHVALFPPIHVSHASVAGPGPRAPPRNKMALYESIAIPSKRHAPGPQPTQSGSSQFLGSTSGPQSSQAPVDTVSKWTGTTDGRQLVCLVQEAWLSLQSSP